MSATSGMSSYCVWHAAGLGGDRQQSGRWGRKQKVEEQIRQRKGIRVVLREGAELICGLQKTLAPTGLNQVVA